MTRDEIEAANPQPGGWALVRGPGVCGWVTIVAIVAIDHAPHDDRVVCVSPWRSNPTTPAARWVPDDEAGVLAIAPPSDEPPGLAADVVAASDTDRDAMAWMLTDDTIIGHAARIVDIAEARLRDGIVSDAVRQLVIACRRVRDDYEAAGRFCREAEASGRRSTAPEAP